MENRNRSTKQNKQATVKSEVVRAKRPYIPLELSRAILKSIDCMHRIVDSDDQMYIKSFHGNANIEFKNGTVYKGKLYNGLIHGQGAISWNKDQSYTGSFMNNKAHGKGKMKFGQNEYEGSFQNGMRHGYGVLKTGNAIYEGQWLKGKMHGEGKVTFKDGEFYSGLFNQGAKHGVGSYHYNNGNVYIGGWHQNMRHGQGKLKSSSAIYEGCWENDVPKGKGQVIWFDEQSKKSLRNRYQGNINNNIREGFGAFFYSNLSLYVGMWRGNAKNGIGYSITEQCQYISAIYKNDRPERIIASTREKEYKLLNGLDNHYQGLIDLPYLLSEKELQEISVVCLRFNTQLKNWYRDHSTISNEKYASFMSANDLWSFVKQFKLLQHGESIPVINRRLFASVRTRAIPTSIPQYDFNFTIERVKSIEDFDQLYYIYHAENYSENLKEISKYTPLELKRIDIHSHEREISFREFIQTIIEHVALKANKLNVCKAQTLTETIERCFKLEILNRKGGRASISGDFYGHSMSFRSGIQSGIPSAEASQDMESTFNALATRRHERIGFIDRTVTLQEVTRIIQLDNLDTPTKYKFYKYFMKAYDLGNDVSEESVKKLLQVEVTQYEFVEFMLKWKSKHDIQSITKRSDTQSARVKLQTSKMIIKEQLQRRRREIQERKMREAEVEAERLRELQERRLAEELAANVSANESMSNQSFSSLESQF